MDYGIFKTTLFKRGWTQLELAQRLGWPASRLSLILHGYRTAKDDEAKKLSKALRVDVDELFPGKRIENKEDLREGSSVGMHF